MILIVSEHGAKIGKEGEGLYVLYPSKEKPKNFIPVMNLEQLVIESKANLTSGAIDLLTSYGIPTLFLRGGKPVGILHSYVAHGTVAIRRAQILAYEKHLGTHFVLKLIQGAVENKRNLLRRICRNRKMSEEQEANVTEVIDRLEHLQINPPNIQGKNLNLVRNTFFAYEGAVTEAYFSALRELIPSEFHFSERNRRPPRDPINSLLSYGYAILTIKILSGVIIAGLEPYAGFLHTDRSGKPSFVLDLIEEFRQPIVDRLILKLVARGEITTEDFTRQREFCKIKEKGKKLYLSQLFETFTTKITNAATEEVRTFEQHIIYQARLAGKFFRGLVSNYQPFILSR